jgi:hypothetical protein
LFRGTSAATPVVTGVAAVLYAARPFWAKPALYPECQDEEEPARCIKVVLQRSADRIDNSWGPGLEAAHRPMRRLNALEAVRKLLLPLGAFAPGSAPFVSAGAPGVSEGAPLEAGGAPEGPVGFIHDVRRRDASGGALESLVLDPLSGVVRQQRARLDGLPPWSSAGGLVLSDDGRYLYVGAGVGGATRIVRILADRGLADVSWDVPTRNASQGMVVEEPVATPSTGGPEARVHASGQAADQPGSEVSGLDLKKVDWGESRPISMALSRDGRYLFVADEGALVVMDTRTGATVEEVAEFDSTGALLRYRQLDKRPVDRLPPPFSGRSLLGRLVVSPDGGTLLVVVSTGDGSGVQRGGLLALNIDTAPLREGALDRDYSNFMKTRWFASVPLGSQFRGEIADSPKSIAVAPPAQIGGTPPEAPKVYLVHGGIDRFVPVNPDSSVVGLLAGILAFALSPSCTVGCDTSGQELMQALLDALNNGELLEVAPGTVGVFDGNTGSTESVFLSARVRVNVCGATVRPGAASERPSRHRSVLPEWQLWCDGPRCTRHGSWMPAREFILRVCGCYSLTA